MALASTSNIGFSLRSATKCLFDTVAGFKQETSGNVGMIFGICAIPVMLMGGAAMDYSRMYHTQAVVNEALDAAVLSAGINLTEGAAVDAKFRQDFEDFFYANVESRLKYSDGITIDSFDADPETGRISASASGDVDMAFLGISGIDTIAVSTGSEAVFAINDVEISMMLDVTGSMGGSKIASLREAATKAVEILIPKNSQSDKVRIGLVPYANSVNAGYQIARKVTNYASNSCVTERSGVNGYTDAPYTHQWIGAATRYCPNNQIQPLTSKQNKLKNEIRRYSASGSTAGHLGIQWSYYMLSENWKSVWPAKSRPDNFGTKTQKFAILMTDGQFNRSYTGVDSNTLARMTCQDMKAKGIVIYSVAFQAPASAEATLQDCSTPTDETGSYYFNAGNGAELVDVFEQIALSIKKLRLAS